MLIHVAFQNTRSFNADLSKWDVHSVTNMDNSKTRKCTAVFYIFVLLFLEFFSNYGALFLQL